MFAPDNNCLAEMGMQSDESSRTKILNDLHSDYTAEKNGTSRTFQLFPLLPAEIAMLIWEISLQRNRLISIDIVDKAHQPPWEDYRLEHNLKNRLGNILSGTNYKLQITTCHTLTPLLRVNRECRQAALHFYRVQIPCDRVRYGEQRKLYFNPEFDYLQVRPKGDPEILADFVHDFKAYDPRGVGIISMGIGMSRPRELKLPLDPAPIAPWVLSTFKATLTSLRRVFFHNIVKGDSRIMNHCLDLREIRVNRSYPVHAATETFDLIADSRSIDADLQMVSVGWDPRSMACLWQQMERNFDIVRGPGTTPDYVCHISSPLYNKAEQLIIRSSTEAKTGLQLDYQDWRSSWEKGGWCERVGYADPDTPEALANAPLPAFGFWVFPLDAFGKVPEEDFEDIRWDNQMVLNLQQHRPQLGLYSLPLQEPESAEDSAPKPDV